MTPAKSDLWSIAQDLRATPAEVRRAVPDPWPSTQSPVLEQVLLMFADRVEALIREEVRREPA